MKRAAWRDVPSREIPTVELEGGGQARVIAGTLRQGTEVTRGPIQGTSTEPLYLDLRLPPGARVSIPLTPAHNAFVYAYEGAASVGDDGRTLPLRAAGVLSPGETVDIEAHEQGAQLLLIAGRPIDEPIVQYGPFVMNTREEIEQAIADYQSGRLAVNS